MREKILEILSTIRPESDFNEEVDFIEAGLLDSYDIVTLVTNMEITFNFRIDGTDVVPENFSSVDSIVALLGKYGVH
ncbi:MAG: acyl carrier protein [Prevotella sp.]|nr:acyl carrier protein [Prevotella sp.]